MDHPLRKIASRFAAFYKSNQRAWLFLFCVVLSASFWVFNSLNKKYVHTLYCPLGAATGNDTLAVTVEGKGFDLFSLLSGDSLPVIPPAPSAYFGTSVTDTTPTEIHSERFIDLERLAKHEIKLISVKPSVIRPDNIVISSRKVPVRLALTGQETSPSHLDAGPVIVRPDSVYIYGPYPTISKVDHITTDPLPFPAVPGTSFKGVYLKNPDPEGIRISTPYVWMYCQVQELTEGDFTIPVTDNAAGTKHTFTTVPSRVKVVFQANSTQIRDIKPTDFVVSVDYKNASGPKAELILEKVPEGVRHVRVIPSFVECYRIEKL
jgi:hypothetical protein